MSITKFHAALGAILAVAMVAGITASASASPMGTMFDFAAENFQGDGVRTDITFGIPAYIPGAGVIVTSGVSESPEIPELFLVGGLDYVEFSITTDDGGFLAESIPTPSIWGVSGLDWGPGEPAGIATGLIFLSFDIDGSYIDLDGSAFEVPVVPNPGVLAGVHGAPAIPLDIAGAEVDTVVFDTFDLAEATMFEILLGLGVSPGDALKVNSMHVGFEVGHIPEPTSFLLISCGLVSLVAAGRRNR